MCWVLLLSWVTQFTASPTWRAPVATAELLSSEEASNPSNWTTKGPIEEIVASADGTISIQRDIDQWRRIYQWIDLPENTKLLRFQADVRTDTPSIERYRWRPYPVLFFKLSEGRDKFPFNVRPMFFVSSLQIDEVIELSQPQDKIELSLVKPRQASWQFSNISLSVVEEHSRYTNGRYVLACLWLITLCLGVYRAWCRARLPTVMVVGVLVGVLGGVLASKDLINSFFMLLRESLNRLGGDLTVEQFSSITQAGHIILFALLTFVVLVFHKRWNLYYTQVIIGIGVLAVATEELQRHALGRSPNIQDFLYDVLGIFAGMIIFGLLRALYKIAKHLRSEPT